VDVERLLFFLIGRNRKRQVESDLTGTRFLCFGGASCNILRAFDPLLNTRQQVSDESDMILTKEREWHKDQERDRGRTQRNLKFLVETIPRRTYLLGSDMSDPTQF
jgi:hypothetical protein